MVKQTMAKKGNLFNSDAWCVALCLHSVISPYSTTALSITNEYLTLAIFHDSLYLLYVNYLKCFWNGMTQEKEEDPY